MQRNATGQELMEMRRERLWTKIRDSIPLKTDLVKAEIGQGHSSTAESRAEHLAKLLGGKVVAKSTKNITPSKGHIDSKNGRVRE